MTHSLLTCAIPHGDGYHPRLAAFMREVEGLPRSEQIGIVIQRVQIAYFTEDARALKFWTEVQGELVVVQGERTAAK